MGFNWVEAKAFNKVRKDSEEFLRNRLNEEYDSLEDQEKIDINAMARWEFAKPTHLRIPKHTLIEYIKSKRTVIG